MSEILLRDIREFLQETGMHEHRFGLRACGNGRLIEQLEGRPPKRSGDVKPPRRPGRVWPETEAKIRDFMRAERDRRAAELRRAS